MKTALIPLAVLVVGCGGAPVEVPPEVVEEVPEPVLVEGRPAVTFCELIGVKVEAEFVRNCKTLTMNVYHIHNIFMERGWITSEEDWLKTFGGLRVHLRETIGTLKFFVDGQEVAGIYRPKGNWIEIEGTSSVLMHEFIHAYQWNRGEWDASVKHEGWSERGFNDAQADYYEIFTSTL